MGLRFGSVGSDQIGIDIVVRRFFLSDSQPDRSVQSEQSAHRSNRSIKAVGQSVNQSVRLDSVKGIRLRYVDDQVDQTSAKDRRRKEKR